MDQQSISSSLKGFSLQQLLVEKLIRQERNAGTMGLPTGFSELDTLINGLHNGQLIVIGGKSLGKTTFALNISSNVATKTDTCVSYFSLGMSKDLLVNRLLAAEGNLHARVITRNEMTAVDWGRYQMAVASFANSKLFIFDTPRMTVEEIENQVLDVKENYPDINHLVVIDYLSLIQPEPQQNRYEQTDYIVKQLKLMARELNCPVVVIANLSRSYNKRLDASALHVPMPRLSDLRDSGTIEEDADVVLLLHRDDYFDKDSLYTDEFKKGIAQVLVAKQQNGSTGTIELAFVEEYSKFINLDRRFADESSEQEE